MTKRRIVQRRRNAEGVKKTKRHPEAEQVLTSAKTVMRIVLAESSVDDEEKRAVLDRMLWTITVTTWGKYSTPIRSVASLKATSKDLRHEHVVPRAWLTEKILREPDRLDYWCGLAVACVVTKEEEKRLNARDKTHGGQGWTRYRDADIALVEVDAQGKAKPVMPWEAP